VSYYRKRKLYPICDRFAARYCALADSVLDDLSSTAKLKVEALGGGMLKMKPFEQQPPEIQTILEKQLGNDVLESVRDLYFLRDDVQSHASNGSFSKDKYNAITNQLFDSAKAFFSIITSPKEIFSQKDMDNFHYYLNKQKHIRNVTLPSIVSKTCRDKIAVEACDTAN
jgi:hypothetical protein